MLHLLLCSVPALALTAPGFESGPSTPQGQAPAAAAPKVVAAQKGDLRATLERKGRLVPAETMPVRVDFEAFQGELKVVEVAAHGQPVNRGDILLRFDTERIDQQLKRAEFDAQQAEQRAAHAEEEARLADAAAQDEFTRAESRLQWARRKLQGFVEHELELDQEDERLSRQGRQSRLEDELDELTQLERMYKEDELVDATEEIVLKRSRRNFANSQAWNKLAERRLKYVHEFDKPIQRERLEQDTTMEARAFERLRRSQALARAGREQALARTRFDLDKQKRDLEQLRRDRERCVVRAGRSGILLHGDDAATPAAKPIELGARVAAGAVLAHIADPDRLEVRTEVPETHLFRATTGKAVEVELVALPEPKLLGQLRVDLLPSGRDGDVNLYRASVPLDGAEPRRRPGMAGKVTIVLDSRKDAVLVPLAAVANKDGKKIVRCGKNAEGPFAERVVVLGPDDGRQVVVDSGLVAGEFVVVEEGKS